MLFQSKKIFIFDKYLNIDIINSVCKYLSEFEYIICSNNDDELQNVYNQCFMAINLSDDDALFDELTKKHNIPIITNNKNKTEYIKFEWNSAEQICEIIYNEFNKRISPINDKIIIIAEVETYEDFEKVMNNFSRQVYPHKLLKIFSKNILKTVIYLKYKKVYDFSNVIIYDHEYININPYLTYGNFFCYFSATIYYDYKYLNNCYLQYYGKMLYPKNDIKLYNGEFWKNNNKIINKYLLFIPQKNILAVDNYLTLFSKQNIKLFNNDLHEYDFIRSVEFINNNTNMDKFIPNDVHMFNYVKSIFYNKSILNYLYDKIFILCDKNKIIERKHISNYFNKYNIEFDFCDAVMANEQAELITYYNDYLKWEKDDPRLHGLEIRYNKKMMRSIGALGILKSMKKIFEMSIDKKYNKILVFDDDVLFDKNLNEQVYQFFDKISSYKLLFLGASQYLWNNVKIYNINNQKFYKSPVATDGSFAIGYDCSTFKHLINQIDKLNAPYDSGPVRHIIEMFNTECYTIYPNIVIADTTSLSLTMNESRNLRLHCKKVKWDLEDIDFERAIWKISVIIANFNSENYINVTLDSLLNQDYKNIEIIVVDDKSTDNCINIIKEYENKDDRVKLIQLNENKGAYYARNIGLEASTGFFVTLLDADDVCMKQHYKNMVHAYFNNPNIEILFSNIYRINHFILNSTDENILLENICKEREPHIIKTPNNIFGHNSEWKYKYRFGLPTLFVERDFFNKYGKWRSDYRYGMDIDLIQRYIKIKFNEVWEFKPLWNEIYCYKTLRYNILLVANLGYVSRIMDDNNATNICTIRKREEIHKKCYDVIKKLTNEELRNLN
jgi:glycosyltransferase involved in cell wall biosynthesis/SepF-like predicted cell division protein (DUF552 family)